MAFDSFLETMRRPKKLGYWADDGRIQPGQTDLVKRAFNLINLQTRNDEFDEGMSGGFRPQFNKGNLGKIANMRDFSYENKPMDVVYNQQPEQFDKLLKFQKDQMNLAQKNREQEKIDNALLTNDAYIDRRRQLAMAQRQMDTPDFQFKDVPDGNITGFDTKSGKSTDTGVKSGTISDAEKIRAAGAERHAQVTQQGINAWLAARENANSRREVAEETARGKAEAAKIAAENKLELTQSPENRAKDLTTRLAEMAVSQPELAGAITFDEKGNARLNLEADEDLRRRAAAYLYGNKNVDLVPGVGSAAISGSLGSAGVSGNIAKRGSPTAPQVTGPRRAIVRTSKIDGRKEISYDGKKTWQPVK